MAFDPSTIIGGPALVSYNGQVYYVEGDVEIEFAPDIIDFNVSGFGSRPYLRDLVAQIRFTPVVNGWDQLVNLLPYGSTAIGGRIFGDTDKTGYVQSLTESVRYTFMRMAVTQMPSLNLSAVTPPIGQVTLTAITDQSASVGAVNSLFTQSATANTDTSFVPRTYLSGDYQLAFGTVTGYDDVATRNGIQIDWDLSLEPIEIDNHGLIDMRLTELQARVRFEAEGIGHSAALTYPDSLGVGGNQYGLRGKTIEHSAPAAVDLIITENYVTLFDALTLHNVVMRSTTKRFGVATPALAYEGRTKRTIATGALGPCFTLTEP